MNRDGFKRDWFKEWFGQEYSAVYAHRDERDAKDLIQLILKHVALNAKAKVLDAACGNGRHACQLTEITENVFGVDLSLHLLKQARKRCRLKIVQGDLRALPFRPTFDLVLNLFTSFGYFLNEEENNQVLKEFYRVLTSNGLLFFDFLNAQKVRQHLSAKTERIVQSTKIIEERKIEKGRVVKKITIESNEKKQVFFESVRLYHYAELRQMFAQTGFQIVETFGDYQGHSFQELQSPRVIFLARKR